MLEISSFVQLCLGPVAFRAVCNGEVLTGVGAGGGAVVLIGGENGMSCTVLRARREIVDETRTLATNVGRKQLIL